MSADLKDGFYWVRLGDNWTVAELAEGEDGEQDWYVNGVGGIIFREQIDEIDPRPIEREAKR